MRDNVVSARAALLLALTQGEGYVSELTARIPEGAVTISSGTILSALLGLAEAGLVTREEAQGNLGGRPRAIHRLTSAGRAEAARVGDVLLRLTGPPPVSAGARTRGAPRRAAGRGRTPAKSPKRRPKG